MNSSSLVTKRNEFSKHQETKRHPTCYFDFKADDVFSFIVVTQERDALILKFLNFKHVGLLLFSSLQIEVCIPRRPQTRISLDVS